MSQSVCILGVTGSIGRSTLKILQQHSDLYSVFAVTGFKPKSDSRIALSIAETIERSNG